jgi:hypothetical protein
MEILRTFSKRPLKEAIFQVIWISVSPGVKAIQKIVFRYIEFPGLNLATNTVKVYVKG